MAQPQNVRMAVCEPRQHSTAHPPIRSKTLQAFDDMSWAQLAQVLILVPKTQQQVRELTGHSFHSEDLAISVPQGLRFMILFDQVISSG